MDSCLLNLFLLGTGVFVFLFWIWMLVECIVKERNIGKMLVWALIIFVFYFIGALAYYFIRRDQRDARQVREKLEGDLDLESLPEPDMRVNPDYAPWKEQ